jgi:hypothetical protein
MPEEVVAEIVAAEIAGDATDASADGTDAGATREPASTPVDDR